MEGYIGVEKASGYPRGFGLLGRLAASPLDDQQQHRQPCSTYCPFLCSLPLTFFIIYEFLIAVQCRQAVGYAFHHYSTIPFPSKGRDDSACRELPEVCGS